MKRSLLLIISTIIVIAFMWVYSYNTQQAEPFAVCCVEAGTKNVYDFINARGKIKEGNKKDIYTNGASVIKKVHVKIGDYVEKGETIIEVEPIFIDKSAFSDYQMDTSGIERVLKDYGINTGILSGDDTTAVRTDKKLIKSPIDGILTDIRVTPGDEITPIKKLASVSDFNSLYALVMVPEEHSSKISEGQQVKVSADAFGGKTLAGKVSRINPVAKQAFSINGDGETYVEAVVEFETSDKVLRPELTVNAKITSKTVENAITIPYECIRQDDNNREYVFVVKGNNVAIKYISVGYELEDEVEVKSGLMKNDKVVLNPPETLKDGDKIKISE